MPRERIVPLPTSENFWSVGGPGPCGPDSEIYYDWGEEHGCGEPDCAPACTRCDRFLEFWNLVFMEYELHADGTLTPLPKQNIDTGLGLERGAAILQDVMSVYETDGYQPDHGLDRGRVGRRVRRLAGRDEGAPHPRRPRPRDDVPRRRRRHAVERGARLRPAPHHPPRGPAGAADRARTTCIALSGVVVEQMGEAYPGARRARATRSQRVLRPRRSASRETLERGLKLFEELAARRARSPASDAFTLAATYGFPLELTVELAEERGQAVDVDGYRVEMERHREVSRAGGSSELQRAADFARAADFTTEFVGYEKTDVLTQIGALEELDDGLFLAKLRESPFYPAGGGQVTDAG